jgi:hypothetical protein
VQVAAGRPAQHGDQDVLRQGGHVADRADAALPELFGRDRADAPQAADRQRVQEVALAVRGYDEQAVRLGDAAGDLGEELRPRHPDRDRQADLLGDLAAQARGDVHRRAGDPAQAADVEERLVDGQALDQRCRVPEHREHGLARRGVRRHPRLDDDGPRAHAAGQPAAHRGADAVRLGLVAGREHDARADDDRPASQPGVVTLFDRRVERVQVGVQDRRLGGGHGHEHMFAETPYTGQTLPPPSRPRPSRRHYDDAATTPTSGTPPP